MPNFAVLLPPTDDKQPGGNPFAPDMFDYRTSNTFNYFSDLNPKRRELIGSLQQAMDESDDPGTLFDLEGFELEEAVRVNEEIYDAPLMSALDRYSPGTLYTATDFANLPTGAQRRMLENGIIFSGLFGLLRPDDLVPNYHLPMDLELPGVGLVADFWRPHLSPLLNRTLEGRFVWDFLSEPLPTAWNDEHTYEARVRVTFLEEDGNGKRSETSDDVETLRGQFVNFIMRETAEELEDLEEWIHPAGYRHDEEASSYDEDTKTHAITMVKSDEALKALEQEEAEEEEE